jgi:hypothetical protein
MLLPGADPLTAIRWAVLALVATGLSGVETELAFIGHYEDRWQVIPIVLIALAVAAIAVHAVSRTAGSLRVVQAAMALLVVTGALGVALHYRGTRDFQLEMDASLRGWPLFLKIMSAEAPPALAPGVLAEFGLLGLVSSYRSPVFRSRNRPIEE